MAMSSQRVRGTWRRLSPARQFVCEMMRHAQKVPLVTVTRVMDVESLVRARKLQSEKVSWTAMFMKAFAMVARDRAYLRRVYMPLPWAHLYEYPHSIGVVMIEREHEGEQVVLGTKVRSPETQSLADITETIRRHKEEPVESLGRYRMALLSGKLPWFLRRLQWWTTLNLSGFKRVKRFGTFGMSSLGGIGVENHPVGPTTSIISFGPIDEAGKVKVRLVFDHRVFDGGDAGRSLVAMEETLGGAILSELERSGESIALERSA